ncbi:hypothetical protein LTR85_011984 [Meristemomyces frigidus]|nr:hypothetical protein LTR85_011984 [Meristemomyces frigidus]
MGTSDAFSLDAGVAIQNRNDGSTGVNRTATAAAKVATTTVTLTVTGTSRPLAKSSPHIGTAVTVGVAVPLGCLLIGALILFGIERKQSRALKAQVEILQRPTFEFAVEDKGGFRSVHQLQAGPLSPLEMPDSHRVAELEVGPGYPTAIAPGRK